MKKKPSYLQRRHKEETNITALLWVGCSFAALVIVMTVLLIVNR